MSGDVLGEDVKRLFSDEELETCPECGERQLAPASPVARMRLCLACGVVPKPATAGGLNS